MKRAGEITPADIEYAVALYDGEISYQDAAIGRLLDSLDCLGLADDTVIVMTADHGEGLMDRRQFFHGRYVYDELIRVPLAIGGAIPESSRTTIPSRSGPRSSCGSTLAARAERSNWPVRWRP